MEDLSTWASILFCPITNTKNPVAYLLEVNAPPSQDTSTGLPHAEALHDAVLSDLIRLWILPRVEKKHVERPGGWQCVYDARKTLAGDSSSSALPSKAALLNKMKWALAERKHLKLEQQQRQQNQLRSEQGKYDSLSVITRQIRNYFPYYNQTRETVLLQ
jgi:hypothetical protein|mmetsp:Transcript_3069/g.5588  ORF Transcript_3069/g.5588 Transcript_3069/m.5588 type:complete len:160 (-) Transcript_3069:1339-1818(-)